MGLCLCGHLVKDHSETQGCLVPMGSDFCYCGLSLTEAERAAHNRRIDLPGTERSA